MAPIYDTDLADERWTKAEWNNYEFWEKVESRRRRKNVLWVCATAVVFLALSSVPIVADQKPKWQSRRAARLMAQEINRVKREASVERAAYRIRFEGDGALSYVVERAPSCKEAKFTPVRSGVLVAPEVLGELAVLDPAIGEQVGVPGLGRQFCYDPLHGSESGDESRSLAAFGFLPVPDLSERRFDRLTVLLLTGPSAEATFD